MARVHRQRPSAGRPEIPYQRLAEVYDRVYSWKDYAREARTVRGLIRRWGRRDGRTLLDVGCGTGAHLKHLTLHFDCTGLDPSRAMLRVARRNVPRAAFVVGRMPRFDLGVRFDAVVCLFSAIGYVRGPAELRRTVQTFARHLTPGGVLVVEPWFTPAQWRGGSAHVLTVPSERFPIVRMNLSETRRGRSVMDMHYLVAGPRKIDHWVERHDLGLFSTGTMAAAFRAAGLRVHRVRSGFYGPGRIDRGLYVGTRPALAR